MYSDSPEIILAIEYSAKITAAKEPIAAMLPVSGTKLQNRDNTVAEHLSGKPCNERK